MKLRLYAVFDAKMSTFGSLHVSLTDPAAIRQFADVVNSPNGDNQLNKHPEDFSLYYIGEFDQDTAELVPTHPKSLITASALVALEPSDSMNGLREKTTVN